MKLEWAENESDYGLEEAAFYEAPAVLPPPPRKHVSFSLRLDLVSIIKLKKIKIKRTCNVAW